MSEQPADTADIWRVYRREWLIVYSLNAVINHADPVLDDLPTVLTDGISEYFERTYAGRVHDDDVRFDHEVLGLTAHAQLELRLPNLKAEYKHRADAEEFVARRTEEDVNAGTPPGTYEYYIVQRNSRADHQLLNYGVKKLPTP